MPISRPPPTPSLTSTSNVTFIMLTTYTSSGVSNTTLPAGSYTSSVSFSPSNSTASIPFSSTCSTSTASTSASTVSRVVSFANTPLQIPPRIKNKQSVTSSSLVIPLSSLGLPIPELIKTGEPNRLREGDNYTAGLSSSSADIAVDFEPPFNPYVLYTYHSHHNFSPRICPYFLLNPPVRSLTNFTSLPSPSGPPNLLAITVTPIASPGWGINRLVSQR
ncbi:hypothetical protein EV359DRAFT_84933 [Lentinula novae-zelandiae]|nr:hypothetical protein EV359DRAFT_84933 [Lentinula novae-zelandiae]